MHAHRSDSGGRRRDCCLGRSVATSSSAALPTASDRRQRLEIATGSKLGLPARQRRTAGDLAAFARLGLSQGAARPAASARPPRDGHSPGRGRSASSFGAHLSEDQPFHGGLAAGWYRNRLRNRSPRPGRFESLWASRAEALRFRARLPCAQAQDRPRSEQAARNRTDTSRSSSPSRRSPARGEAARCRCRCSSRPRGAFGA